MTDPQNKIEVRQKMKPLPGRGDIVLLLAIAAAALGIGAAINAIRPVPLLWSYVPPAEQLVAQHAKANQALGKIQAPGKLQAPGEIKIVSLEEARRIVEQKEALVLDARPGVFYELGHLPDAVNLSRKAFDLDYARILPKLTNARVSGYPLLVYCADMDCPDAAHVADHLKREFPVILLFAGGWAAWEAAGFPLETSP